MAPDLALSLKNIQIFQIPSFWVHMNHNPPVSEASREVENLTWRKNPHTPVYGVKEFVCLSVAKFDLNYLRTGKKVHLYLIIYII